MRALALLALLATPAYAQTWTFDAPSPDVSGAAIYVPGIHGQALVFDGDTTRATTKANPPGQAFTISAWGAVNAYPWNTVPILDQSDGDAGYSLSLDAFGHTVFTADIDGQRQSITSRSALPLRRWAQVTATFDGHAMALYIDGKLEQTLKTSGPFIPASTDILIGRTRTPQLPYPQDYIHPKDPVSYSFDGWLDDVQVRASALPPRAIAAEVAAAHAPAGEVIPQAVLPPPEAPGPFGAFYTTLAYTPAWDAGRHSDGGSDVVVRFPQSAMRLVFWAGTSYVPAWVTANNRWYSDEFVESYRRGCPGAGDCEPMSDRQNRYSRVTILESTPARAVVRWRYALADSRTLQGAYADPDTGWSDWAEETWTVYPDGVAVRKQVLFSNAPDDPEDDHEWQESIVINGPGQRPEDSINSDALTLANMNGETKTYSWGIKTDNAFTLPKGPDKLDLDHANIQWINLKAPERPFQVVAPDAAWFDSYNGEPSYAMFEWWNHWPLGTIDSSGRPAVAADRASHSSLSHIHWGDYEKSPGRESKLLLDGLTTRQAPDLLPMARSWLQPPLITGATYDPAQRAFILAGPATLDIPASPDHPLVDPAFVIDHWQGNPIVSLRINGQSQATEAVTGIVSHLNGDTLIVYLPVTLMQPAQLTINR